MWLSLRMYEQSNHAICEVFYKGHLDADEIIDCGVLLGDLLSFEIESSLCDELCFLEDEPCASVILPQKKDDVFYSKCCNVIADSEPELFFKEYKLFLFSKAFASLAPQSKNFSVLKKMMSIFGIPVPSYRYEEMDETYNLHTQYGCSFYDTLDFDTQFKNVELLTDSLVASVVFEVENIGDATFALLYFILERGYTIKKCSNCKKLFIAYNRSDTLYCNRHAPQDKNKTCKEYGAYQKYKENLKNSETAKIYRNIYQQKQMLSIRNPDIIEYKNDFEQFKIDSKQWKADVKKRIKTEQDFLAWLKSVKEKKG